MDHHSDPSPGLQTSGPAAPPNDDVLERYLSHQASAQEMAQVEAWLATSPRARTGVETLEALVHSAQAQSIPDTSQWVQRILFDAQSVKPPTATISLRRSSIGRIALGTGAGLACIAGMLWINAGVRTASSNIARTAHYATSPGQRATISLPGGHRIVLGPSTTLSVTSGGIGEAGYNVLLRGQALFSVTHHAGVPFVVQTKRLATHVLGTTFDVREYEDDSATQVAVVEGRVSITPTIREGGRPSVQQLSANMLSVIDDSGHVRTTQDVPATDYIGWSQGILVFRSVTAHAVAAELSRAYGVTIQVSDSTLARQRVDWYVETEKYPLTQALHELSVMLEAHFVRSGDAIILAPGRRAMRSPQVVHPSQEVRYGR